MRAGPQVGFAPGPASGSSAPPPGVPSTPANAIARRPLGAAPGAPVRGPLAWAPARASPRSAVLKFDSAAATGSVPAPSEPASSRRPVLSGSLVCTLGPRSVGLGACGEMPGPPRLVGARRLGGPGPAHHGTSPPGLSGRGRQVRSLPPAGVLDHETPRPPGVLAQRKAAWTRRSRSHGSPHEARLVSLSQVSQGCLSGIEGACKVPSHLT